MKLLNSFEMDLSNGVMLSCLLPSLPRGDWLQYNYNIILTHCNLVRMLGTMRFHLTCVIFWSAWHVMGRQSHALAWHAKLED